MSSEWASLLLVVWALYALHGLVWRRAPRFHFSSWWGSRRAAATLKTWSTFGPLPNAWRLRTDDIPFALSSEGLTNLPVGSLARPSPLPRTLEAWRWAEIQKVETRRGRLWINGRPFAPATGHLTADQLRALAAAAPAQRAARIDQLLRDGLRPQHLRRLQRLLLLSTSTAVSCNLTALFICLLGSLYLGLGLPALLDSRWSDAIARGAPWVLGYAALLQIVAFVSAWSAGRRLARHSGAAPGKVLGAVLFMPPQSFHLRALLGESLWPVAHPLAAALAFGSAASRREAAFNVLADLDWPLPAAAAGDDLPRQIARDHRARLRPLVVQALRGFGIDAAELLAPPQPDSPGVCAYCPRCGDQFVKADGQCPHRIPLRPL